MATVKYLIQYSKENEKKPANIRIHFRQGNKFDCYALTGKKILPDYWNNGTKGESGKIRDIAAYTEKNEMIRYLNELRTFIENEETKVYDKFTITSSWLKTTIDRFNHPEKYEPKKLTLFEFIELYIQGAKSRTNTNTGRLLKPQTIRRYITCFNYLKAFAKHGNRAIDFNDIDIEFYDDFVAYLTNRIKTTKLKDGTTKEEKGLAVNTIGKQIAVIKAFMNFANEEGHTTNTNHKKKRFKKISEKTDDIYLNEQQLEKLFSLDLTISPRLDRVRDLFMIGAWTGCRYSDFHQVNPKNIIGQNIKIRQYKGDETVMIPLHPVVTAILKKYNNDLPRVISNKSLNKYLKELGQLAGLNEPFYKTMTKAGIRDTTEYLTWEMLKAHTARRSFATNLYKSGFPSISIMKITGHKTETEFLKYIKVTPQEHADKLREHWLKTGVYDQPDNNQPVMVTIAKSENNYMACVEYLDGFACTAPTFEQLKEEIEKGIKFHIDGIKADGDPVPTIFEKPYSLVYRLALGNEFIPVTW